MHSRSSSSVEGAPQPRHHCCLLRLRLYSNPSGEPSNRTGVGSPATRVEARLLAGSPTPSRPFLPHPHKNRQPALPTAPAAVLSSLFNKKFFRAFVL